MNEEHEEEQEQKPIEHAHDPLSVSVSVSKFIRYGLPPLKSINGRAEVISREEFLKEELSRSEKALQSIFRGLSRSLVLKDFYRGSSFWLSLLNEYLDQRLPISLEQKAELARICHGYIVSPSTSDCRRKFSHLMARLLRPRNSKIGAEEMELDLEWKHIYNVMNTVLFRKQRHDIIHRHGSSSLIIAAKAMRRFFANDTSQELYDALSPYLCVFDEYHLFKAQGLLVTFMPTNSPHFASLFSQFDTLWDLIENTKGWDAQWMVLFARFANTVHRTRVGTSKSRLCDDVKCEVCSQVRESHNGNAITFEWEPHIPKLFARFLRALNLPVGSGMRFEPHQHGIPPDCDVFVNWSGGKTSVLMNQIAALIVLTISPSSSVLRHLAQFTRVLSTYFHPSNSGSWSPRLALLLQYLTEMMTDRIGRDFDEKSQLPQEERLSKEMIIEFVECLLPLTLLAVYSKSRQMVSSGIISCKNLVSIAPTIVLPILLPRICDALLTVNETHQTAASLEIMAICARNISIYGNREILLDILTLSLPGIDANDLGKTHATLRFYLEFCYFVFLWDEEGREGEGEGGEGDDESKTDEYFANIQYPHPLQWNVNDASDSYGDSRASSDKSSPSPTPTPMPMPMPPLSEWCCAVLDKIFDLLTIRGSSDGPSQDSGSSGDGGKTRHEKAMDSSIYRFVYTLFAQMGARLYRKCMEKTAVFCMENILLSAASDCGHMFFACCQRPDVSVLFVLPLLLDKLMHKREGEGGVYELNHLSEAELKWYLRLMSQIAAASGCHIIPFIKKVTELVTLVMQKSHIHSICKMAGKILRHTLNGMTSIYPVWCASVPKYIYTAISMGKARQTESRKCDMCIGSMLELKDTAIDWHVPCKAELECASVLVKQFAVDPLMQLKRNFSSSSSEGGGDVNDFFAALNTHVKPKVKSEGKDKEKDKEKEKESVWKSLLLIQNTLRGVSSVLGELPVDSCAARSDKASCYGEGVQCGQEEGGGEGEGEYEPIRIGHMYGTSVINLNLNLESGGEGEGGGEEKHPRLWLGDTLHSIADGLLSDFEESPLILKLYGKIIDDFLVRRGYPRDLTQLMNRNIAHSLNFTSDRLLGKKRRTRSMWIDKCCAIYLHRFTKRGSAPYHTLNALLSSVLFRLSHSLYLSIRRRAQKYLIHSAHRFRSVSVSTLRGCVEVLSSLSGSQSDAHSVSAVDGSKEEKEKVLRKEDDPTCVERLKGTLHLLDSPVITRELGSEWETVKTLIHGLINVRSFERRCIQANIVRAFAVFANAAERLPTHHFENAGYDIHCTAPQLVPSTATTASETDSGVESSGVLIDNSLAGILQKYYKEGNEKEKESESVSIADRNHTLKKLRERDDAARRDLVDSLTQSDQFASSTLHWRFKSILCGTLVMLIRDDLPPTRLPHSILPYLLSRTISVELVLRMAAMNGAVLGLAVFKPRVPKLLTAGIRGESGESSSSGSSVCVQSVVWLEKLTKELALGVKTGSSSGKGEGEEERQRDFQDQVFYGWNDNVPPVTHRYSYPPSPSPTLALLPESLRTIIGEKPRSEESKESETSTSTIAYYADLTTPKCKPKSVLLQSASVLCTPGFFKKLLDCLMLESSKQNAQFNSHSAQFFKSLFQAFDGVLWNEDAMGVRGVVDDLLQSAIDPNYNYTVSPSPSPTPTPQPTPSLTPQPETQVEVEVDAQTTTKSKPHPTLPPTPTLTQSEVKGRLILCAEIIAGCSRASKHWSVQDQTTVCMWVRDVYVMITPHCGGDLADVWASALHFILNKRDPRRFGPLIRHFFSGTAFSFTGSSLIQSVKLQFMSVCLHELSWRATSLGLYAVGRIKPFIGSPYKHIRDGIACLLSIVFEIAYVPGSECVSVNDELMLFVEWVGSELERMSVERRKRMNHSHNHNGSGSSSVEVKVDVVEEEEEVESESEGESETETFRKNVLSWLSASYGEGFGFTMTPYIGRLLPSLFRTSDDSDPELKTNAETCLGLVARSHCPFSSIGSFLAAMKTAMTDDAWHVRSSILPFLQLFVYHNSSHLQLLQSKADLKSMLDITLTLLNDPVAEVRHEASTALSGILKIVEPQTVDELRVQFIEWSGEPVPRRRRRFDKFSLIPVSEGEGEESLREKNDEKETTTTKRHAGILGLISIILSHPFDLPDYFPDLLVRIAKHISDPSHAVCSSIRLAFREFWRTHSDSWSQNKDKFTEDQRITLTELLVAPNCFI